MDDQSCIKALSQLQGLDQWIFSESADYCSVEAQLDTYKFAAVFVKQLLKKTSASLEAVFGLLNSS